MKTINELVNKLNQYGAYGEYYVRKGKAEEYLLCKRCVDGGESILFDFAKRQPYWSIHAGLGAMHNQVQEDLMDFVYSTDKEHWFDETERKYNIIVGRDLEPFAIQEWKAAYMKTAHGVKVWHASPEKDFINDEFIFTESEVEDLKSELPENMAKIVDLGKVEIKDENN